MVNIRETLSVPARAPQEADDRRRARRVAGWIAREISTACISYSSRAGLPLCDANAVARRRAAFDRPSNVKVACEVQDHQHESNQAQG